MRVLTVWQPTAAALMNGLIQYEVRSRPVSYRGPLALHAGKRHLSHAAYRKVADQLNKNEMTLFPHYGLLQFGSLIAVCDLVDCVELTDDFMDQVDDVHYLFGEWMVGNYALKFANMQKLKNPIPTRGRQGLWQYADRRRTVGVVPITDHDSRLLRPADRRFYNEERSIG